MAWGQRRSLRFWNGPASIRCHLHPLGTPEKQLHCLGVHATTTVSAFPAPRLTFLIHKTTCLINLPQIAPLKNPVCQMKLSTQLINCIPRLPQSFCVNQNRWLMSNLDTEEKKTKHLTHAFIFFLLFFAVFDHLASRDWENELSWNAAACMICLFRGRRLWPLCEHDLSLLGVRHLFFRRTQWKSSSPFLSQKAEVHYFSILFT